ncbi:high voltage activated calcium channel beta [Echinococcus multilocularis]|uniref:High voltage activated calcium channel beta n=1 Tax=Echinococcus multilocularis TaxID=6211 RepID=A0A068YDJ3_ECHMU|nr:high voltage activated calcium channel beta [Echinococcus multilocularis]
MNRASFYGNTVDRSESSDESSDEDQLLLRAELREQEQRALVELDIALNAPVAFCVRTNVEFDGLLNGLDAPIPTKVISFAAKEFLQVKRRFDQNWWIGRVVRDGSLIGFLPSPSKLETLRHSIQTNLSQLLLSEALNVAASSSSANASSSAAASSGSGAGTNSLNSTKASAWPAALANGNTPHTNDKHVFFRDGKPKGTETLITPGLGVSLPDMESEKTAAQAVPSLATTLPSTPKKKPFFKKGFTGPPYDLVPNVRPVVVVGPALKGYEVTDMMQKALFDSLKRHFEGRLIATRVVSDISAWKRLNVLVNMDKKALTDRTRGRQIITALEVQREIERIFDLATSMQLVVLDSEAINHPHQIAKSPLAPIMVYIKISSIRVLQRLIKNRGKTQKKQISSQVAAAERLLQCAEESFDVVLEQNSLESATEALANYLESYLKALHHYRDHNKGDRQFSPPPSHMSLKTNEAKPLPPMIPGRPGLNIAFAVAGSAGFQLQELAALAGDRHAGHSSTPGEGECEGGNEGEEGDEEREKKEGKDEVKRGEGEGDKADHKMDTDKTDRESKGFASAEAKKKSLSALKVGKAEGKREGGGILKLGAGKKHKQTLTQIIPDRAHAIALAEAVVKNANAAAAAAAATRLDVPGGATIGLHQSHQAAHSDPSGTPKIYASRSSRQAKQRQEEMENARRRSEEAARAAAEARAASGAQRQEKRRQRRLLLAEQAAATAARYGGGGTVKFGDNVSSEKGLVLDRGSRARMPPDEESQSSPGSNLRRNTSSATEASVPLGPKSPYNKAIPLIIHPPSEN